MAEADFLAEGRRTQAMKTILEMEVAAPINSGAAAALTVAYAILKTDYLSRGEQRSDPQLKEEVQAIYWEMRGLTDVKIGLAQRAQAQRKR